VLESFYKPQPRPMRLRSHSAITIHLLLIATLYTIMLILTQRLVFSIGLSIGMVSIVLVINNAKYATLKEPLVFTDFYLYLQVFKHPRLYLPFLGIVPLILLTVIGGGVILAGLVLEKTLFKWLSITTLLLALWVFVMLYLLSKLSSKVTCSQQIESDCEQFGVLVTSCVYAFKASKSRNEVFQNISDESLYSKEKIDFSSQNGELADIVVVQSESFFDARHLSPNILEKVLSAYDECLLSSQAFGKLSVPAWGANTMRTEFGFLTGLTPLQLGLAQYYPYQQLSKFKIPSIVSVLKSLGYYCVCIHPNASGFFMRDKFFKQLGFDDFLDEESFGGAVRTGPYIADQAVTNKIMHVLNSGDKPCFIFAITMENHGPLHLEAVATDEWKDYYESQPSSGLDDLTVYLRHLKNADKMISQLCSCFKERSTPVMFSLYGDHVPAISHVFDQMGYEDARSNYFIWSNTEKKPVRSQDFLEERVMKVESLGLNLLEAIGALKFKGRKVLKRNPD